MGMDLLGLGGIGHGEISFNNGFWYTLLEIAEIFGWQPAGTVKPSDYDGRWNGSYFTNDFQEVTDADARALSDALQRAVAANTALVAVGSGQPLTKEHAKALGRLGVTAVRNFDFARSGGFSIS